MNRVPDVSPDLPPLHWRATLRMMRLLPQGAMSRAFGRIADVQLPARARVPVLSAFARTMGINVEEAEKDLGEYGSINEFFVRRLRAGVRSVDADPRSIVSPVDGVIGQFGIVQDGALLQAKGRTYSAAALLGDDGRADRYRNGSFITVYLSPRHYHRIHAPVTGDIELAEHIPGALFPVNAAGVMHVDALFPRNERLTAHMGTQFGSAAVVAVGAYNVGRISAAFDVAWNEGGHVTNRSGAQRTVRTYDPPVSVRKGDEIMAFHLGSTVVLLFEHTIEFAASAVPGAEVTMGEALGVFG